MLTSCSILLAVVASVPRPLLLLGAIVSPWLHSVQFFGARPLLRWRPAVRRGLVCAAPQNLALAWQFVWSAWDGLSRLSALGASPAAPPTLQASHALVINAADGSCYLVAKLPPAAYG